MVVAIAPGSLAYRQYQKTAFSELNAIVLSSDALFASHKGFDALLQAIIQRCAYGTRMEPY